MFPFFLSVWKTLSLVNLFFYCTLMCHTSSLILSPFSLRMYLSNTEISALFFIWNCELLFVYLLSKSWKIKHEASAYRLYRFPPIAVGQRDAFFMTFSLRERRKLSKFWTLAPDVLIHVHIFRNIVSRFCIGCIDQSISDWRNDFWLNMRAKLYLGNALFAVYAVVKPQWRMSKLPNFCVV